MVPATRVMPPAGESTVNRPPSGLDAIADADRVDVRRSAAGDDLEREPCRFVADRHRRLGAGVGALEHLEAAQVHGSRDLGWTGHVRLDVEVSRQVRARRGRADRDGQPARLEQGRIDVLGKFPRLGHRQVHVPCHLLEQRSRSGRVGGDQPGGHLEVGRKRDQVLLHALVQLTLDRAALGVVDLDESPARCAQADDLCAQPVELLRRRGLPSLHGANTPRDGGLAP